MSLHRLPEQYLYHYVAISETLLNVLNEAKHELPPLFSNNTELCLEIENATASVRNVQKLMDKILTLQEEQREGYTYGRCC